MNEYSTAARLSGIKPGDHLCCIYQTEEEHRALLTPYLSQGLERGEKILYIVDAHTAGEVLGYLRAKGIDVGPFLDSGQLNILTVDEAYMREGVFDPDGMIELLTQETEKALSEGYSALRVTGEMSWALRGLPGSERLMEYESKLNRFFPGSRCLAICQYDRRRFSPEVLLDVLTTHPYAVVGTEVYDNFYYMPPQEFLGDDLPLARLEHWIDNLANRKRVEEQLRFHAKMLDSVGQAVITTDAQGTVVYWNRPAEELYGWTAREAVGRNIMELTPSQASGEEAAEIIERLRAGERWSGEFEVRRKDGSTFMAVVTDAPIFDEKGDLMGIIGVSTDLTERLRMEEELRRINRELDAYTYIVSHDLRGPVSVVISASKTLRRLIEENRYGEAAEDIEKIAGIIAKSADNAEQLIDNLLVLAQAGQASKQLQDVDVGKLIKRILIEKSDVISHRGVRIKTDGGMGIVCADPTHIYQLFANLIGNAIEHNDSPEPEIEIFYGGTEKGGHRYLVRDNGSGIREKDMNKLFYPFYHGKGGGAGIGLAIVRKIVDIYGGDIRVYNDNGACFDFNIKETGYNKQ